MKKLLTYSLLLMFLASMSLPDVTGADTPDNLWRTRSLDMAVTDRGIAVGGTWTHGWNRDWRSPLQVSLLIFSESDKVPRATYYGYEKPRSKRLLFLNTRTGFQRRLWSRSLASNVQPYLFLSGGPSIAIDPSNGGGFFSSLRYTTFHYTAHVFTGVGVDFVYSRIAQFSVAIGYEFMRFFQPVDGSTNYSGVSVVLSFGERL